MNEKKCNVCGEVIHPLRLEILPQTRTCVQCSQESKKAGRLVSKGRGEDVETELEILDQEIYRKLVSPEFPSDEDILFSSSFYSDEEE